MNRAIIYITFKIIDLVPRKMERNLECIRDDFTNHNKLQSI